MNVLISGVQMSYARIIAKIYQDSPKSRPASKFLEFKLNLISCSVAASFTIVFHNDCSYFIHHQSCFNLSKKNFHLKDINAIKFPCYSCHLQFAKSLPSSGLKKLCFHCLLNNFQAFLKPVTLFIRTWDIW